MRMTKEHDEKPRVPPGVSADTVVECSGQPQR